MTRGFVFAASLAAFVLVDCGGRDLSIGSDLSAIGVDPFAPAAPSCPSGCAHPNACCKQTGTAPMQCVAWVDDPFRPCPAGYSMYANASQCRALEGHGPCCTDGTCGSPPILGEAGAGSGGTCAWTCGPGETPAPGTGRDLFGCCSGSGNDSACWAVSTADGGFPSPPCHCPSGWSPAYGQPNLCCRYLSDRAQECFVDGPSALDAGRSP